MKFDIEVNQSTQGVGDGGGVGVPHAGVAHHTNGVVGGAGFKAVGVFFKKSRQTDAAAFFFAFDHDGDVAGQWGAGVNVGFECFEEAHDLALVVGGTAGVELAVTDGGFKRGGGPAVERVGGLHVVVAIKQNALGCVGGHECVGGFGKHNGVATIGRVGFNREAQLFAVVTYPRCGAIDLGLKGGVGADAGNGKQLFDAINGVVLLGVEVGKNVRKDGGHGAVRRIFKRTSV